jgi:hypothetical protein
LCWQRGNAAVIDGDHVQQFAIGLGRIQFDAETAIGIGDGAADQRAVGMHFHAAASRRGTGEGGAVGIDGQVARAVWGGGQRYVVLQGHGGVAAWVGLHQAQVFARLCGGIQVDQEGAVGTDHARADHGAVGIAHFDGGTRFATAAQGRPSAPTVMLLTAAGGVMSGASNCSGAEVLPAASTRRTSSASPLAWAGDRVRLNRPSAPTIPVPMRYLQHRALAQWRRARRDR